MRETQELVTIVPWTFIATICNLFIQWLARLKVSCSSLSSEVN